MHRAGAVHLQMNGFHPELNLLIHQKLSIFMLYFLKMNSADVLFDLVLGNSKSYLYF